MLVGRDFTPDYQEHLEKHGIIVKVIEKEDEFSATYYAISDEAKQQIGIWQPNAYGKWIDKRNCLRPLLKLSLRLLRLRDLFARDGH